MNIPYMTMNKDHFAKNPLQKSQGLQSMNSRLDVYRSCHPSSIKLTGCGASLSHFLGAITIFLGFTQAADKFNK